MASSALPQLAPSPHQLCRRPALSSVRLGAARAPQRCAPRPARLLAARAAAEQSDGWAVEYLVDMECPLRRSEVASLLNVDRNRRISFVDISARDYAPAKHSGVSYEDAMGAPAARLPDGTVLRSAEVYGALYGAVGLGAVWQLTRLPGVRPVVDAVFRFWAEARLPLTGRGSLAQVLKAREAEGRLR